MTIRFIGSLLLTSMLGLLPAMALAQTPRQRSADTQRATASKVDSAKEADIRRMFVAMGGAKKMDEMIQQMFEQASAHFQANLPETVASTDRGRKMTEALMKKVRARIKAEDLIEQAIPIYDKYFSDDDIVALTRFYETPLGQKYIQVMPDVSRETLSVTLARYEKIMPEIMREMEQEFPELREEKPGADKP